MRRNEIKKIKEYSWGSVVTIIEGNITKKVITAKAEFLIPAFMLANVVGFIVGVVMGRL